PLDRLLAVALLAAVERLLVDRHHGLEGPRQRPHLVDGAALHRGGHHRRRGLADRAALAPDPDVLHPVVLDVEVEDDLVAAERVEALDPHGRRRRELATVPRVAVVVEDDLAVEVFEAGHAKGDPIDVQVLKNSAAAAMASDSASTSDSS